MQVLLVEHDQASADSLSHALEERGYFVDVIDDRHAALDLILKYPKGYDLIILDSAPESGGGDLCSSLRGENITVPILMLASQSDIERPGLFTCGANDYLVRPFSDDELFLRVDTLTKSGAMVPAELKSNDISMNIIDRTVFKGTEPVKLTSKEFALLEYFMRHPNEVLSRKELVEHVWEAGSVPGSNTVDAHVKNLRKKIDSKNGESLFKTVRGVGYRYRA